MFILICMETKLEIIGKSVYADSRVIADGFGLEHRSVYRLILSHKKQLESFGLLRFQIAKPKTGRPQSYALLNEEQALLLLTYTRSNQETDYFRQKLISQFTKMRKALLEISLNKNNQKWLDERKEGKLQRKQTTDIIKQFVDYATEQGSKNAQRYYANITSMENKALFFIEQKFPNLREVMTDRQLSFIKSADVIIEEAIREGLSEKMPYKEIYKLCKKRAETLADIIPKTLIPMQISNNE